MKAEMKIDIYTALSRATKKYPYYARGFAALTPVKSDAFIKSFGPTFGVDKYWRLYWSEESISRWRYDLPAVMCHELEHLLREHYNRVGTRDRQLWNIATDMEINDDIEGAPSEGMFPGNFGFENGLMAEEYYSKLYDSAEKIEFSGGACGGGSGVDGEEGEHEVGAPKDVDEAVSVEMSDTLREAIANDVNGYESKNPGTVPLGVKLWAEAICKGKLPKISWRKVVSRRVKEIIHGSSDWSYNKPSRRQDSFDKVLLPGKITYRPTISVVLDTSGSMSDMADWVAGCFRDVSRMKASARVIDCDADVQGTRPLKKWQDVLKSRGGGGTDMRIGIRHAQDIKSDLILVLTDGYTPWPDVWPKNMVAVINDGNKVSVKTSA